jgi:hypothetical protein
MNTIPTAEEFFLLDKNWGFAGKQVHRKMIEFAKLHVEAALKAASKNATVTSVDHEEISEGSFRPIWGVDEDSILNAYPSTNIK